MLYGAKHKAVQTLSVAVYFGKEIKNLLDENNHKDPTAPPWPALLQPYDIQSWAGLLL